MKTQENLRDIIFYSIESAIKAYRQYAQRIIKANGFNITIDQWLVLKTIQENPEQTQHQIAETVFKDHASLTRIIDLLVKKKYLGRINHSTDRRRFKVTLTPEASSLIINIQALIENNRSVALRGITEYQTEELQKTLNIIINNCKS